MIANWLVQLETDPVSLYAIHAAFVLDGRAADSAQPLHFHLLTEVDVVKEHHISFP